MHRNVFCCLMQVGLLVLLGCDSSSLATGRVRDTKGRALDGVIVRFESGTVSARALTNKAGVYSVTQALADSKSPADLTYCKTGYHLARRWFDDSRSIPQVLNVTLREIDTTDTPARVAGARAPCAALNARAPAP